MLWRTALWDDCCCTKRNHVEETCPLENNFLPKNVTPVILKAIPKNAGSEKSSLLFPMKVCLFLTAFHVLE